MGIYSAHRNADRPFFSPQASHRDASGSVNYRTANSLASKLLLLSAELVILIVTAIVINAARRNPALRLAKPARRPCALLPRIEPWFLLVTAAQVESGVASTDGGTSISPSVASKTTRVIYVAAGWARPVPFFKLSWWASFEDVDFCCVRCSSGHRIALSPLCVTARAVIRRGGFFFLHFQRSRQWCLPGARSATPTAATPARAGATSSGHRTVSAGNPLPKVDVGAM